MDSEEEEKILAHRVISAAAKHDTIALRNLLRTSSAKVQDAGTGYTKLHAAVVTSADATKRSSIDQENLKKFNSGDPLSNHGEGGTETVALLLENGAIWNDLDRNDETPGCIASRLGLDRIYRQIVEAGVRAELLLSRLNELDPDDEDDEISNEDEEDHPSKSQEATNSAPTADSAAGTRSAEPADDYIDHWDSNTSFLRSSLRFTDTQLLDSSSNAVMMEWEREIMQRHATTLLPKPGLRAMNIGHGMGILDTAIQSHNPAEHHIVEAHPAVLAQMRKNGWFEKPGVRVHEGRWQDVLPRLVAEGVELDAIYYDTFAEEYKDLKFLFEEHVIGLMMEDGRFGFYNGLGADRRVCNDVYTEVRDA